MRRYLVVAHQTLGSSELLEAMRDRVAEGACTFHLLVPEYHGGSGLTWTEGKVRAEAMQHLEEGRLRFIAEGLAVTGEVGDANPVDAVRWHQELRRSADAWRELTTCGHEAPLRHHAAIAELVGPYKLSLHSGSDKLSIYPALADK